MECGSRPANEEVLGGTERVEQLKLLGDQQDALALGRAHRAQHGLLTVEEQRPGGRLEHTRSDPGDGALAGTVLAEQCMHLTGGRMSRSKWSIAFVVPNSLLTSRRARTAPAARAS